MTCRHSFGDPNCSSYYSHVEQAKQLLEPLTPDAERYVIQDVQRIGRHLVLRVQYPNCKKCAYEGCKIMVFLNVTEKEALCWKKIDPHFTNEKHGVNCAPSPAARFPASEEGWKDAIIYAQGKQEYEDGCR